MHRFFVNSQFIQEGLVYFEKKDFHHIRNVLYLKKNDQVKVWDEDGKEYLVKLLEVGTEVIRGEVIEILNQGNPTGVKIILAQALPKGKKFDFIIEKATELGAFSIIPLITERVIVKLKKEEYNHKKERWQKIAYSASRQSGRNFVPEVNTPLILKDFCKEYQAAGLKIACYEGKTERMLKEVLQPGSQDSRIVLVIGPEGGFSDQEVVMMQSYGFIPTSLGPRIFRTETMTLVILSIVQYIIGDLG